MLADYRQSQLGSREVYGKQQEVSIAIADNLAVIHAQLSIEEQYHHTKNRNKSI